MTKTMEICKVRNGERFIIDEEERFHKLLYAIFDICELANFEIEGRIILVDKQTGRVWR